MTSPLVIFETVFTLQKSYEMPRARIRSLLLSVVELRHLELMDKPVYHSALELFATTNLSLQFECHAISLVKVGFGIQVVPP